MQRLSLWVLSIALFFAAIIAPARASDHADPLHLTDPGSNITDLFLFPEGRSVHPDPQCPEVGRRPQALQAIAL